MRKLALFLTLLASVASAQNIQPPVFSQPDSGAAPVTFLERGRTHKYVTDFAGVKCDGKTDDTAGMRNAVTSAPRGSATLRVPGRSYGSATVAASPCVISGELQMSKAYSAGLVGEGPYTSRISQTSTSANAVTFHYPYASGLYYATFRDIALSGPGSGTGYGIDMRGSHAHTLNNVFITGFGGAGVRLDDSIVGNYQGCRVQTNTTGFLSDGSGVGVNGFNFNGCYVSGNLHYGFDLYSAFGTSWTGTGIEGNAYGGLRVSTSGGGLFLGGLYFEENQNSGVQPNFDLYLGSSSYVRGAFSAGIYINGRLAGATYDYRPIRLKFADAHHYEALYLLTGNRLYRFEDGGVVTNSFFGAVGYSDTVDVTDPGTLYDNVPADFLTYHNRINDPAVVPTDGQNMFVGTFPYAWDASLGAGSTFTLSANLFNGHPSAALVRTTDTSQISRTVTVSATTNARARNRFVSYCQDMYVSDATQKNVQMSLTDGSSTATQTFGLTNATPQSRYCVSLKTASGTTSLTATTGSTSLNATIYYGNDSLFVGMDPEAAPQYAAQPLWTRYDINGSKTYDPASVSNAAGLATTVTVTGAELGDYAECSFSIALGGMFLSAEVSAADTVTCRYNNNTGGAVDLGSGTLRARAFKKTSALELPVFAANEPLYKAVA